MNLREDRGYTYGSYSSASTIRYKSRFLATASVRSAVTVASIKEIVNEINQIRNEFVLKKELSAVKEKYIGNFIMATEKPATIANFELNKYKYSLPDNFYKNYPSHIQNVSISDIKKVTIQYFLAENLKIIVIGNAAKITPQFENYPYKISFYDTYGNPTD